MEISDEDKETKVWESKHYFGLKDAVAEVKADFACGSTKDKISSSAKLLGKSAFNLSLLSGKLGVEALKRAPEIMQKMAADAAQKR